jgi:recombination protein RecT
MELVRRSGQIKTIEPDVVYEKDEFSYSRGTDKRIEHVPFRGEDRGRITAAYAIATLANGEVQFRVVEEADLKRITSAAQGTDRNDSPWKRHRDAMCMKSAMVRLCKFLPMSFEMSMATIADEHSEEMISPELEASVASNLLDVESKEVDDDLDSLLEPPAPTVENGGSDTAHNGDTNNAGH